MRGWLPKPPIRESWLWMAGGILLLSVPFAWVVLTDAVPPLGAAASAIGPLTNKTHFGLLRYVHFLALAYLAFSAVTILGARFTGPLVDVSRKVGQQSLGVFLASLLVAQISGVAMASLDYSYLAVTLANLSGFAALVAVAHVIGWFKSTPWKQPAGPVLDAARAERASLSSGDCLPEAANRAGAL